jgi:hypothetical protein
MKQMKKLEDRLATLEERLAELSIPEEYRFPAFKLPEDQEAYNKYEAWFKEHPDPRKKGNIKCIIIAVQERDPEPGMEGDDVADDCQE